MKLRGKACGVKGRSTPCYDHSDAVLASLFLLIIYIQYRRHSKTSNLQNPQKLIRVIYRFKMQDDRIGQDDLAAWACIRLDRLRGGYRFVHLLDGAGFESKGVLLVYIQKTLT